MKRVLVLLSLIFIVNLSAGEGFRTSSNIDKLLDSTNKVLTKVEKSYRIIENSTTGKSVYTILKEYEKKDEAKLAIKWFRMATQLTSNRKMAFLINNSSIKIKALLSKLSLLKSNPLSKKDREFLFKKIDFLVDRTAIDRPKILNEVHISTIDLFIRSMPIVNELTKKRSLKKFKVLKKGDKFKLLYKLEYKGEKGYPLIWGFIETNKNQQQGWININKINIK